MALEPGGIVPLGSMRHILHKATLSRSGDIAYKLIHRSTHRIMQSEETVGIYFKQKIKKKTTERELNEREAM